MKLLIKLILNLLILGVILHVILTSAKLDVNGNVITMDVLGQEYIYEIEK